MAVESLSHSFPKEIREAQYNSSNMYAFFACVIRLLDSVMLPIFVAFIDALFVNWTDGPSHVSLSLLITNIYSLRQ